MISVEKGFDFNMKLSKLTKKLLSLFTVTAMVSATAVSMFSGIGSAYAVDDCNDDWIHAEGSKLYDKDGNQVWITGANWFGFNCGERFPHGLWSADVDQLLSSIADHGINCLRLPIATELLMDWQDGVDDSDMISINPKDTPDYSFNPDFCRPDGSCMSSLEIFDVIMSKCKKYGIKILVDIHSPALHNSGHNYNVWYYNSSAGDAGNMAVTADGIQVTTEMWQDTLVWLADRYKNDDTLIAYDLKNEPHGKGQEGNAAAKWDDSTDENNWAYAATQCANAIMEVNPNALVLVEGVEQYPKEGHKWGEPDSKTNPPYYPGWWGGQLRGVRDYPLDLGEHQSQLVYSPHDYGPGVFDQTWFQKDFTTQTLLDDYWYDTWAYINEEDIAPLLIGEWGGFMDGDRNEKWLTLLRDYMIDNHINHTFWCINPNSGDTGGLLDYSFANWDEEKYALFEKSLWQTQETGKFIGLDHNTALGKNGISLNEFYASYASTEGSNINGGTVVDGDTPKPTQPVQTSAPATTESTATTVKTTEKPVETTAPEKTSESSSKVLYGDADLSGTIDVADVVVVASYVGNPDSNPMSEKAILNSDVQNVGNGVDASDVLAIQQYLAKIVKSLPV